MKSTPWRLSMLLLLVALAGCGREQAEDTRSAAASGPEAAGESALLAWVPEDTPFVAAIRQPLPEAQVLEFLARLDPMADLQRSLGDLREAAQADPSLAPAADFLEALVEELGDLRQPEAYARLGLRPNPAQVVYGLGLVPVARIELADAERFDAFLARMIERAGVEIRQHALRGVAYRAFSVDGLELLSAIVDGHWVLTLAPVGAEPALLGQLLGLDRPQQSLLGSPRLREIERRHGLLPHGVAHLSTDLLFAELLKPSHPASAALASTWGGLPQELAACGADLERIAARLPGLVAGLSAFDGRRSASRMVLLTDAAIAADLAQFKASVPGMDRVAGLASLSLGFNLGPLPAIVQRYAGELRSQPLDCAALAELNGLWEQFGQALANPAVFMVAPAFSGLRLQLDGLRLDESGQPTVEGHVLIASPNAEGLVSLTASLVPQLAALDLKPGEAPKRLPDGLLPLPGLETHIALAPTAVAIGLGERGRTGLAAALAAAAPERPLLLHAQASGAFYTVLAKLIDGAAASWQSGTDPGAQLRHYGKVYRQQAFSIVASEYGLELALELELN